MWQMLHKNKANISYEKIIRKAEYFLSTAQFQMNDEDPQ